MYPGLLSLHWLRNTTTQAVVHGGGRWQYALMGCLAVAIFSCAHLNLCACRKPRNGYPRRN